MSVLYSLLVEAAQAEGFPLSGAVDLDESLGKRFSTHVQRYDQWLSSGFAGSMDYLVRGRDRRADPRLLFSDTKSVFCVAAPYDARPTGALSSDKGPRYARYLRGHDYHLWMTERLEKMMTSVALRWQSLKWKVCVDTSAVLERSWAALAGLGWIGKNTLLIHPQLGSYLFLGEVLINQKLDRSPQPLPNYCGSCNRCLEACPTGAFIGERNLDSRKCISYLTLEKRGPLDLDREQQKKIGVWVAGCDICQEVCPFNQKAARAALSSCAPSKAQEELDATELQDWKSLFSETEEQYKKRVSSSALKRVKPDQFRRNLVAAHQNQEVSLNLSP